ncbi:RNA-directed DNA polymerase from mobile element jockey-like, partial [Brachionus plicatilis]
MEKVELFGKLLDETFKDKNLNNYDNKHKEKVEEEVANYLTKERSNEASFKISELEQAINKLNISLAPGPDNIHNLYLINSSDDFRKLILDLLNLSARTNALPNAWKITRISMIPKKKANSTSPKDYRPVSVTSCL